MTIRKRSKPISFSAYKNSKYLVRVEWVTKDDFLQKWYECKTKDEAKRLISELNLAFDHPHIWLYREVPLDEVE